MTEEIKKKISIANTGSNLLVMGEGPLEENSQNTCPTCGSKKFKYVCYTLFPMPGWFVCENGHNNGYYNFIAGELFQIQSLSKPNTIVYNKGKL
jgi:hypothetical protein